MTWVRVLTAVVVAPPVLAAVFLLSHALFALMWAGIILLGAWEWSRLAGVGQKRLRMIFVALIAGSLAFTWFMPPQLHVMVLVLGVVWWGVALGLVIGFPMSLDSWNGPWRKLGCGWMVLIPAWTAMVALKRHPDADALLLLLLLLIWGADVGAYFAGRRFGRRKLAPHVSPGKSWEGVMGGMALGIVVTVLVGAYKGFAGPEIWATLLLSCIVTMAASVLGDLFESVLKRMGGHKDSGRLLPGHGGVMDRIDSLTAAAPVFALCVIGGAWLA